MTPPVEDMPQHIVDLVSKFDNAIKKLQGTPPVEDIREQVRYALGSHTAVPSDKDPRTCLVCGNIVGIDHEDEKVEKIATLFSTILAELVMEEVDSLQSRERMEGFNSAVRRLSSKLATLQKELKGEKNAKTV